jgi:hypothetical protein
MKPTHRSLLLAALVLAVSPVASEAVKASDPVLDTLGEWTRITIDDLRLEGAPPPHRVVTSVADVHSYNARARFGSLIFESPAVQRQGRVEVIVGDDKLDSSRFSDPRQSRWAQQNSDPQQRLTLPIEDGILALRRNLWFATDESYKHAVQRWQAKVAARNALGGDDQPPDWSPAEPIEIVDTTPIDRIDGATLRQIAVEASAALRGIEGLDQGELNVNGVAYRCYTVTSEGTRMIQPEAYVIVHAMARALRPSGVRLHDEIQWVRRLVSDLPPTAEIVAAVRAMGEGVAARLTAETVDYYEGPVVFEDRAAAEFFRYLIPTEVNGTPPIPQAGLSFQRVTRSGPRLGRHLLRDGWTVVDDPSKTPEGLAGGYVFDREGVQGQRVVLVEDGYVRDFLTSRVPRSEGATSNGHARGGVTQAWVARPSVWQVDAPEILSDRAFWRVASEARDRARQDRVLVVRRLRRGRVGALPTPTLAVWRFADGSEQPVDSLEFQGVDRRTLRSVIAAGGGTQVLPYVAAWMPDQFPANDRGLPTVVTTPRRLLVDDLELVFPGPSEQPYAYPAP